MTPAQLAEAPPNNNPTHPAVAERIISEMGVIAGWIDRADAAVFATNDGWEALQTLRDSVDAAERHAELYRPAIH